MKISGILLAINIAMLAFIWIFTALNYSALPDMIPTHFVFNGTADGESPKKIIWFLPSIATLMFLMLAGISRDPDSPMLNIPERFRNKEKLKLFSCSILIPLMLLFCDTIVETVLISRGKLSTLSHMTEVLLVILCVTIGVWLWVMIRKTKPV